MAEPAPARSNASNKGMIGARIAIEFWSAVKDCLVTFHQIPPAEASQKVTELWRRLANIASCQESGNTEMPAFDDIIYHEEPWYIACNLADCDKPLDSFLPVYQQILKRNHLA